MIETDTYQPADITGHEKAVKNRVKSFVESVLVEGQERVILARLNRFLHNAVDYVMNDLPTGVDRVDGVVIKPILNEVVKEKLEEFPIEEIEEGD